MFSEFELFQENIHICECCHHIHKISISLQNIYQQFVIKDMFNFKPFNCGPELSQTQNDCFYGHGP